MAIMIILILGFIFFVWFIENEKDKETKLAIQERKKGLKLMPMSKFKDGDEFEIEHANYIRKCMEEATKTYFLPNIEAMKRVKLPNTSANDIELAIIQYIEEYNRLARVTSATGFYQQYSQIDSVRNGLKIFPKYLFANENDERRKAPLILHQALNEVLKSRKQGNISF